MFFFFQAEDGIRDWSVTGVQTCALPILDHTVIQFFRLRKNWMTVWSMALCVLHGAGFRLTLRADKTAVAMRRSEERRVGKECRSRWSPYHKKEKNRMTERQNVDIEMKGE